MMATMQLTIDKQLLHLNATRAWLVPPCPPMIGVFSFWPRICNCTGR